MTINAMLRRRRARSACTSLRPARRARKAASRFKGPNASSESYLQRSDERAAPARNARRKLEFLVEDIVRGEVEFEALVERFPGQECVSCPIVAECRAGQVAVSFA